MWFEVSFKYSCLDGIPHSKTYLFSDLGNATHAAEVFSCCQDVFADVDVVDGSTGVIKAIFSEGVCTYTDN